MLHFLIFLYFSPHLEYSLFLWGCQRKENMDLSEQVQRIAMKMIGELEYLSYKDRLRDLKLLSLDSWRLSVDPVADFQYLKGLQETWTGGSQGVVIEQRVINGFKLEEEILGRNSLLWVCWSTGAE